MAVTVQSVMPNDLVTRIDEARGQVTRSRWLADAAAARLAMDDAMAAGGACTVHMRHAPCAAAGADCVVSDHPADVAYVTRYMRARAGERTGHVHATHPLP